jgi:hypothetical protein
MNLPSQSLPLPSAYYDRHSGGFWFQDAKEAWLRLKEDDFIRFLTEYGYSNKPGVGEALSAAARVLMKIQMEQNVDYAGPLAGYQQELIDMEGKAVLVTKSPKVIPPVPGDYPVLLDMLLNMFGAEQLPYFEAWVKMAYESLVSGNLRSGHALVMAGPRNSGKTLVQLIMTKVLGGRVGHPYQHMTGMTSFNSDLFGCEHLSIDDECGSTEFKSRQKLTAQFKMITAAGSQHCHAKGEPALTLTPFWRLTVSVNDDPESLLVLPLIREDLADKVMLFKIEHHTMHMPTSTNEERDAFWNQLMADLPHWLHHLTQWEIPAELKANRFGVKHYHHTEIMDAIEGLSPEMKLYDLLKDRFARCLEGWRGTASELETLLAGDTASTRYEARKIFTFNHACARYLERLSKKHPAIVMRDGREHDRHYWKIVFPQPRRDEVVISVPVGRIPAPPVIGVPDGVISPANLGLVS